MKRLVLAALAALTVAIAVPPAASAAVAPDMPGSGTLTWAVPTDLQ